MYANLLWKGEEGINKQKCVIRPNLKRKFGKCKTLFLKSQNTLLEIKSISQLIVKNNKYIVIN